MPITIPPRAVAIPALLAAIDAGQLQAQRPGFSGACSYSGPCAIGAMLPPEDRATLDAQPYSTAISGFLLDGIVHSGDWTESQLCRLQTLHDEGRISHLRRELVGMLATPVEAL